MSDRILNELNLVMRDVFVDDDIDVARDSNAEDVDGWDSLSHARLVMEVERHFKIKLAPGEVMDLGNVGELVDLIASCGGHLWLEAQPAGNMVAKIHLPKPPAANATDSRGGRVSKWFRPTSAANVRA